MMKGIKFSFRRLLSLLIFQSFGEAIELKTGESVRLTTDETYRERCSVYTVYVDFMYFAEQVKKNDIVLLDNEEILLLVEVVSANTITCKIERGGMLGSHKDVFLPNKVLQMPDFTDRDKSDIEMAMRYQVCRKLFNLLKCSYRENAFRTLVSWL